MCKGDAEERWRSTSIGHESDRRKSHLEDRGDGLESRGTGGQATGTGVACDENWDGDERDEQSEGDDIGVVAQPEV